MVCHWKLWVWAGVLPFFRLIYNPYFYKSNGGMPIINDTDIKKAELQRMMTQLNPDLCSLLHIHIKGMYNVHIS